MDNVKPLNAESFADAMMRCYQNKHYRAIIFFESMVEYIEFVSEFRAAESTQDIPGVANVSVTSHYTLIMFENRSIIEITFLTEASRAKRCNMILYDEAIDIDAHRNIIHPMIVRYVNLNDNVDNIISDTVTRYLSKHYPHVEEDADSSELDEFLDGFKIIDNT